MSVFCFSSTYIFVTDSDLSNLIAGNLRYDHRYYTCIRIYYYYYFYCPR